MVRMIIMADSLRITPDYFSTMGIRVLEGRVFNDFDTDKSKAVGIVDETLARRYFPSSGSAIGKKSWHRTERQSQDCGDRGCCVAREALWS